MTAQSARSARLAPGTGLTLGVLSAATFGTSGAFAASLIHAGWSPGAVAVARIGLSALVLTVPALLQMRGRWILLRQGAGRAVAFGLIAVAGCQLAYFNAIQRLPVGVALLLEYLGAIMVVAWLWLAHQQRPRRRTVAGATAAIAGLVLVLNLTGSARLDPVGVMWGLLAAFGLASYFLLSAQAGADQLPPVVMAWAGMCVGAVTLAVLGGAGVLPMVAAARPVDYAGHQVSWIVPVLELCLVAAVISYVTGIAAARRLGAKVASFVSMSEVLFAILFAWLLLGQLPSAMQFLGGACILAGVALVRTDELSAAREPAAEPEPPDAGQRRLAGASRQG